MTTIDELRRLKEDTVKAARASGDWIGMVNVLADQYSDKTHFIFELLQNADDADATEAIFDLHDDRLEFAHNGKRLFTDVDLKSIVTIGASSKRSNYTKIGKHGIGFKAVFAYTHTPRVHSGEKHFDIVDVIIPIPLKEMPPNLIQLETLFKFPFDTDAIPLERRFRNLVSAEDAYSSIQDALQNLSLRTPLFLRHIKHISWKINGKIQRKVSRDIDEISNENTLRIKICDGSNAEHWIVFHRDIVVDAGGELDDEGKPPRGAVKVAFLEKDGHIIRAENTKLVVFFPTAVDTKLGFIIHGPFKTTKARDNIKGQEDSNRHSDPANNQIVMAAAQLAADSLSTLCDLGLLDVSSYAALPLQTKDFPVGSLFRPVYDKVREAFKTQRLLPAHGGGYIKANEAKLARVKRLVELFSPKLGISSEQFGALFGKEKLMWLNDSITVNGDKKELYEYLLDLENIEDIPKNLPLIEKIAIKRASPQMEITPEILVPKLTAEFLKNQPIGWLIQFIEYAISGSQKRIEVPIIRLLSGKQVSLPSDKHTQPSVWFVPKDNAGLDLSEFHLVHTELAANESIKEFLQKEGIREIDAAAIVVKCILPRYKGIDTPFDEHSYRDHLRQIRKAYSEANDVAKEQLTTSLNGVEWLACVHASGKAPDKIVWKKPGANDVFTRTSDHEIWFNGLDSVDAYFLHPSLEEELNGFVSNMVKPADTLTQNLHPNECDVYSQPYHHMKGLNGFKANATVVGLKGALVAWNAKRAKILWNVMLSAPRIIGGNIKISSNKQKLDAAKPSEEFTEVGKLCRDLAWLPDKNGEWRKPSELFLSDLPDEFDTTYTTSIRAKEVADKLGMIKPEVQQAAETLSKGNPRKKLLFEQIANASDADLEEFEKLVPRTVPPMPAPSFKDGLANMTRQQRGKQLDDERFPRSYPVSNPDSYQDKLNQAVVENIKDHAVTPLKINFFPVRNLPSNKNARDDLYREYQGCCQVTGKTFPKASANSDGEAIYYFEACSLLSYGNADYLNDAGNMLCVSADTMAKFNNASFEWLDDIEHKIAEFENVGRTAQVIQVRIRLAGEECIITWNQRHFMQLVALYQNT